MCVKEGENKLGEKGESSNRVKLDKPGTKEEEEQLRKQ